MREFMPEISPETALVVRVSNEHRDLAESLFNGLDSNHTRRAYIRSLVEFFEYADEHDLQIDKAALDHYKRHLRDEKVGDAAINQRLSAIRRGLREMADRNIIKPLVAELACKVKGVA